MAFRGCLKISLKKKKPNMFIFRSVLGYQRQHRLLPIRGGSGLALAPARGGGRTCEGRSGGRKGPRARKGRDRSGGRRPPRGRQPGLPGRVLRGGPGDVSVMQGPPAPAQPSPPTHRQTRFRPAAPCVFTVCHVWSGAGRGCGPVCGARDPGRPP